MAFIRQSRRRRWNFECGGKKRGLRKCKRLSLARSELRFRTVGRYRFDFIRSRLGINLDVITISRITLLGDFFLASSFEYQRRS